MIVIQKMYAKQINKKALNFINVKKYLRFSFIKASEYYREKPNHLMSSKKQTR